MFVVVTGAAGFVGSHLAETLAAEGHQVLGIDCFTDFYDRANKLSNLASMDGNPRFQFVAADLRSAPLESLLDGADVVFHQAGQPGVRSSWSTGFADYCGHNILATQRLLEASKVVSCPRIVYASSSSVYGNAPAYPTTEADLPRPHSPYGVTKLAAEHLCSLYAANWRLPTVSLRYFTVYGPRQRPDMAIQRLVDAALTGTTFPLFGTGRQVRDFTYVADVVAANIAAATADVPPGTVLNIAGGADATMGEVIDLVGDVAGRTVILDAHEAEPGDVERTGGSIDAAYRMLEWEPVVPLREGVAAQVAWARTRLEAPLVNPRGLDDVRGLQAARS